MKKILLVILVILSISGLINGCVKKQEGKKDITITFGLTPWTSTLPPTYVAKKIIEDMGYTVKLQNADVGAVFAGLSKGDIDAFMDSWLPDMHKNYMEKYKNNLEDVSVSYPDGVLGWVTPTYVDNINSITDIKANESLYEGKIYGIEEGAGMTMTSRDMIEEYGLNLEYVASSEAGMLTQAKKIISQKKPVLFLGWRPHPMFVNFDLKVLADPKNFWKTSEVHVLTSNNLYDRKWRLEFILLQLKTVKIFSLSNQIFLLEIKIAEDWIQNNQDKVSQMTGKS